jgi:hypothetical protein
LAKGAAANSDSVSSSVSVRLRAVQMVYLHQLWMEVVDYVFNGILGTLLYQAAQSAGDFVASHASERNSIDVHVTSPTFVLPRHRRSQEHFLVQASGIRVVNGFSHVKHVRAAGASSAWGACTPWYPGKQLGTVRGHYL